MLDLASPIDFDKLKRVHLLFTYSWGSSSRVGMIMVELPSVGFPTINSVTESLWAGWVSLGRDGAALRVFKGSTCAHVTDEYKTDILLYNLCYPHHGYTQRHKTRSGPNIELIIKGSSSGGTLVSRIRITQYKYGNLS